MSRVPSTDAQALTTDLWAAIHGLAVLSSRRALEVITPKAPEALIERQLNAHLRAQAFDGPSAEIGSELVPHSEAAATSTTVVERSE